MARIRNMADLQKIKEEVQSKNKLRSSLDYPEHVIQIKVGMATCGIASGAKETMKYMIDELEQQAIDAIVTKTGCLGHCYAEPTVEVILPGKEPVLFGYVDKAKVLEIIDLYIKRGEPVEGTIPLNFQTIDE
jgi:NADP-reducing hydrogenase subunit HndB